MRGGARRECSQLILRFLEGIDHTYAAREPRAINGAGMRRSRRGPRLKLMSIISAVRDGAADRTRAELLKRKHAPLVSLAPRRLCLPLPGQLRLGFRGVRAIRTRVLLLDTVVGQLSVSLELGRGAEDRRAARKSALVLLARVAQHVLLKGMPVANIRHTSMGTHFIWRIK